jgi:hypothetical protein
VLSVSLFRRLAGIVVALVGVIFLVIGILEISSQSWTLTTATVQSCTPRIVTSNSGSGRIHTDYYCQVSWQDGGASHTATIDLGTKTKNVGQSQQLRVHGDSAAVPTPGWLGWVFGGLGILLLASGVWLVWPRRRASVPV